MLIYINIAMEISHRRLSCFCIRLYVANLLEPSAKTFRLFNNDSPGTVGLRWAM